MNKTIRLTVNKKKQLLGLSIAILLLLSASLIYPANATETFDWSKPRPSKDRYFKETVGKAFVDGKAAVGLAVTINNYEEDVYGTGYDGIGLNISVSANTRVGINYDVFDYGNYYWYDVYRPTNISADDAGVWLPLSFKFLFYGVYYTKVWVCSNSFLCFDSEATDPNPQAIPNNTGPNTIAAPFWRDLNPAAGGSITYDYVGGDKLVVSWNNVLDKQNAPQTFQVILYHYPSPEWNPSDGIWFQYKSVTKSSYTVVGVENQLGDKGTSYNYVNVNNERRLTLEWTDTNYRLDRLTIKMNKTDNYAIVGISKPKIGGYNVITDNPESNPCGDLFVSAIKYAAGLLITGKGGIIFKTVLIIGEAAGVLSNNLSPPKDYEIKDAELSENEAYIASVAQMEEDPYHRPFDATLAAIVCWEFIDLNDKNHTLTVTAELDYVHPATGHYYTISTSVNLNMYTGYHYLDIYADGPGTTNPWPGTYVYAHGTSVPVNAIPWGSNFVGWCLDGSMRYENPIYVTMDSDHSLIAHFQAIGDPGACPTLFVWNGTAYVDYGVVDIHDPSGEDVIREVFILKEDVAVTNYQACFMLREGWPGLNFSESLIDQVKLYAIINGNRYPCPLIDAIHSTQGNVWPELILSDEKKTQMLLLETINLTFAVPYPTSQTQAYTFVIEGCNMLKQ